jgi:hypothetical protein
MIQDAVVRNLEVVGAATKQVPESLRERAPELSWREMAGMRDKVVHDSGGRLAPAERFGVDRNPPHQLIEMVKRLLGPHNDLVSPTDSKTKANC